MCFVVASAAGTPWYCQIVQGAAATELQHCSIGVLARCRVLKSSRSLKPFGRVISPSKRTAEKNRKNKTKTADRMGPTTCLERYFYPWCLQFWVFCFFFWGVFEVLSSLSHHSDSVDFILWPLLNRNTQQKKWKVFPADYTKNYRPKDDCTILLQHFATNSCVLTLQQNAYHLSAHRQWAPFAPLRTRLSGVANSRKAHVLNVFGRPGSVDVGAGIGIPPWNSWCCAWLVMPVRFHHQMVSLKSTSRTQFVAVLKDTALRSNNQSSVDIE